MDVGGDASTKRPLLEEDEEADASGVSSNSHGATSTYGRAPRQVRAAQDAGRYGRLEASGEDEADDGRLDEGEVDTASQFYECEEDEALMASSPASASPSPEDGHPSSTSPTFAEPVSSPAPAASSSVSSSSSTAQAFFLRPSARNARDLPLRTAAAFSRTATARSDRDEDEPADGSVAIEMPSLIQQTPGACSSANRAAAAAAAPSSGGVLSEPVPMSTSSIAGVGTPDRHCFICLQDEEKDNPLTPCCTTCFARVHVRCWREWRNNQRITALRSRLLGLRMQTNHLLRCTICKSGTALVAGEEDGLEWMNELLCGGEAGRNEGPPAQNGPMRREDSDEDNDVQFEELVDMKTCLALVVYLAVLILVLLVACLLIVMQRFYAGDVILCCIIALYELSVLQIVALAVARRRGAQNAAAAAAAAVVPSAAAATREDTSVGDGEAHQDSFVTAV